MTENNKRWWKSKRRWVRRCTRKDLFHQRIVKIKGRKVKLMLYPFHGNCGALGFWSAKKDEIHIDSNQGGNRKRFMNIMRHEHTHATYCIEMQALDGRSHKVAIKALCAACKRLDAKQ